MKVNDIACAIAELEPQDAAFILTEALCRLGELGRPAGELLRGQREGLGDNERVNFDEGMAWVEDELVDI